MQISVLNSVKRFIVKSLTELLCIVNKKQLSSKIHFQMAPLSGAKEVFVYGGELS